MHLIRNLTTCIVTIALATGMQRAHTAAPFSEQQVKAVYLFNFGQFVEWPASAYPTETAPFVIGVVGDDPLGDVLEAVVRGESHDSRPIEVRRRSSAEQLGNCNILFVGRAEADQLTEAVAAVRGRGVLTVTDVADGERNGAMIVLVTEKNRVRMRINPAAAKANGLTISSKLLRPAEIVGPGGTP